MLSNGSWSLDQKDEGLKFEGSKMRNLALLAKWGWRHFNEENSLWKKVIRSIHRQDQFNWCTAGKDNCSLE